jgi:hypothetical protein
MGDTEIGAALSLDRERPRFYDGKDANEMTQIVVNHNNAIWLTAGVRRNKKSSGVALPNPPSPHGLQRALWIVTLLAASRRPAREIQSRALQRVGGSRQDFVLASEAYRRPARCARLLIAKFGIGQTKFAH